MSANPSEAGRMKPQILRISPKTAREVGSLPWSTLPLHNRVEGVETVCLGGIEELQHPPIFVRGGTKVRDNHLLQLMD